MKSANLRKKFNVISFLICVLFVSALFGGAMIFSLDNNFNLQEEVKDVSASYEDEITEQVANFDATFTLSDSSVELNYGSSVVVTYQANVSGVFTITSASESIAKVTYSSIVVANNDYEMIIQAKNVGTTAITVAFAPSSENYSAPENQTLAVTVNKATLTAPTNIKLTNNTHNNAKTLLSWDAVEMPGINVSYKVEVGSLKDVAESGEDPIYVLDSWASQTTYATSFDFYDLIQNSLYRSDTEFGFCCVVTAISSNTNICLNSPQSNFSDLFGIVLIHADGFLINGEDVTDFYAFEGEILEIEAVVAETDKFVAWEVEGGVEVDDVNSSKTTLTVTSGAICQINYVTKLKRPEMVVLVNNAEYGSVDYDDLEIDVDNSVSVNENVVTIENNTSKTTITITANPTASTEDYIYEFVSWTGLENVDKLEDDIVIMANFAKRQRLYNINFEVDENSTGFGNIDKQTIVANLGESVVFNGNVITIGENVITATPTDSNNEYVYSFVAWEGQIAVVEDNVTIKAVFKRELNKHEVTILVDPVGYGTVSVESLFVEYGTIITINEKVLTIGGQEIVATEHSYTPEYTYQFDGFTGVPDSLTVLEPVVITANFSRTANSYTLTLDPQGAEIDDADKTKTITYGEVYGALPQLTKEGNTFKGWFTSATDGDKIEETSIVENASNHTLYAQWDKNTYKITFELNYEGTTGIEKSFKFEEEIVPPTTSRRGYTFEGWFEDESCQTPFTTTHMPAENLIVYASWSQNTYKITLDLNYTNSVNEVQTYHYNDAIELPEDPTREGYTFLGWHEKADESSPFGLTTMPDNDIYLYAHWQINEFAFTYNFNYQGAQNSTINIVYGTELELLSPTRTGYTFKGWYNEANCENVCELTHMPARAVEVFAKWENIDYKLTYVLNYEDAENQEQIYHYEDTIILLEPTREGYLLIGWYNEQECLTEFDITSMPAQDITVYAKWEIRAFLLTFKLNYENTTDIVQNNDYLQTIVKPQDPTRTGYTFKGWFNESAGVTEFTMTQMPAQDVTVYAKWDINSYKLIYDLKYDDLTLEETYDYNATVTLKQPTRTGYTFRGWYNEDELQTEVELSTMPANDVTIYAKWEINSYTITATAGENGTISPEGAVTKLFNQSQLFTFVANQGYHVSEIKIDNNPLSETELANAIENGYLFENISNNRSIHVEFSINQFTITATSSANGDISPVGQVVKNYGESQIFTFVPNTGYHVQDIKINNISLSPTALSDAIENGFSFNNITQNNTIHVEFAISSFKLIYNLMYEDKTQEQTYDYLQTITLIEKPEREGYTFIGWYNESNLLTEFDLTNMPANDVTIYAKWSINSYSITYNFNYQGTTNQTETYEFNEEVTLLSPTRPGYTFGGWYYDTSFNKDCSITNMPADNIEIYAKWLVNAYTLTFNLNFENSENVEKDFDAGETVIVPSTIVREGYSLVGWYYDSNCTNPFDYVMPIYDLTIYAKWQINTYTITYNLNYENATNMDHTYQYLANILLPEDPTRVGYTFKGWFEDDKFNKEFTASKMPAKDFEVYAKWEIQSFVLTFDLNYLNAQKIEQTFDFNSNIIKIDTPTREGYTFVNWYNEPQCSTLFTTEKMPANNLTVYAKWQINSYTITYNLNYENLVHAENTYVYNANIVNPSDPTRVGYTFAGWFNETNCTTAFVTTNMPASNLIVYAKWNINSYKITYNLNYANAPANPEQVYEYAQSIDLIDAEREGYTFAGWYTDATCENKFNLTTMPAENINVYAKWNINSYIISANNGANGLITPKGYISKVFGESQLFTFTANEGYHVSKIIVDDVELTGGELINAIQNGYLFENVNREHTIYVEFEINKYIITATMSGNGDISPLGESEHEHGSTAVIRIQPKQGNSISSVIVDGNILTDLDLTLLLETGFVFENVVENHSIHIVFTVNSYSINASFEGKGNISPSGEITVYYSDSLNIQIYPSAGQYVAQILVDGVALSSDNMTNALNNGYLFENINDNHTIHVVFASHKYNIYVNVEGEGKFYSQQSLENIPYGESVEFIIETDTFNYSVEIYVNGQRVNAVGKVFRIENVKEDLYIEVEFVKKAFFETILGIITIIGSNILVISIVVISLVVARIKRKRRARIINK